MVGTLRVAWVGRGLSGRGTTAGRCVCWKLLITHVTLTRRGSEGLGDVEGKMDSLLKS